jgi:hypothetical protein
VLKIAQSKKGDFPLLGMGFLSRFRMTFDYAHSRMLLEPAADYRKRAAIPGSVGFEIKREAAPAAAVRWWSGRLEGTAPPSAQAYGLMTAF